MSAKKQISYQQLSVELDEVLASLQSGDLSVEEAIKNYERGMEIVQSLQAYLKESQNKVEKIKKKFEN